MSACFGADDSVTACRTRLERIANQQQRALEEGQKSSNWAVEACRSWESIDSPDLVEVRGGEYRDFGNIGLYGSRNLGEHFKSIIFC